ncbi:MAG: pitrilysin family protein, partial [Alphaproteobacteria bacterium]
VALSAPAAAEPIQVLRSPGGLEFWLIEDHAIPVVSLTVTFRRGGAAGDPDPLAGRAELVSTLLDEGAGHMDGPAFQERMRDLAAEMRARVGLDEFSVSLRMLSRNRQESVKLLHLALSRPRFDDQAVDRMRAQALAGLRREATRPAAIARTLWYRTAFPDHPYGRPVSGSEQTLNAMTVADLRAFVADRLTRDRLVIGIAGDVTPDEARGLVDLAFGDLPAHGAGDPLPPAAVAAAGQTLIVDHSSPQATILTGQLGLRRDDPDWYAALVMNHILGGGSFTSRLYSSVREESGLAYSVDSYLVAFDEVGVLQATAATANATAGDALNRMRAEWRRLATTPPTAEEVEAAQDFLVGSFPLTLTSTTRIAATLAGLQIETLGADYLQRREGLIRRVTAADVARVARRLLQPDRLLTVVVGAPAGVTGEVVDSD